MSWYSSSGPYTPVKRRSAKVEPLTPDQVKYILENPYPTGYTYANSSSYSVNKPRDYIHPNLSRPALSSIVKDTVSWVFSTLFLYTPLYPLYLGYQKGTSLFGYITIVTNFVKDAFVIFFKSIQDFFYTNGYMIMQLKDDIKTLFEGELGRHKWYELFL
uniref:Uncharacterized protein n=1 Tax=Panagrolaimus superbus TaxID=310955 RepID=A0A914YUA8_9BILA